jgi:lipoprotein-anchoring transpeptidase ErfK/SrfK
VVAFVAWSGGVSPVLALAWHRADGSSSDADRRAVGIAQADLYVYPTNTPTATHSLHAVATPPNTDAHRNTDAHQHAYSAPDITPGPIYLPTAVVYIPPAGASGERWIDVDLTNQMVYAYEGSQIVNSFLTSTGTWEHPTVTGQYNVYIKLRYTDMAGPGYYLPDVPYTMYFYKGYGVHGTYWHNNFGTPMSHGCVNLSIPDSEWLFNFASVGTLVNVHY